LPTHSQPNSDIPALLLAFPAVAASYLGFGGSESALLRTSLAARLSLLASGVLSLLSAILYLMQNAGVAPRGDLGFIKFLGVQDSLWLLLLAVALANLFVIARTFVIRLKHFQRLKNKRRRVAGGTAAVAAMPTPRTAIAGPVSDDTGSLPAVG